MKKFLFSIFLAMGTISLFAQTSTEYDNDMALMNKYIQEDNMAEAFRLCKKYADQDNAEALGMLGIFYEMGWGTAEDKVKAFEAYTKAAELGSVNAMQRVGECYEKGIFIKEDKTKAAKWYMKAANSGDLEAMFRLGKMYLAGQGVEKDSTKGLTYILKAAHQNHSEAQFFLGVQLEKAGKVEEAISWYEKCVANGDGQLPFVRVAKRSLEELKNKK